MIAKTEPASTRGGFARLLRDSALYSLGTLIGKATALLVLPLVTRRLAPDAYGQLEVLSTLASALTSVAILGLDLAVTRRFADLDEPARAGLFATWRRLAGVTAVAFGVVLVATAPALSDLFFGDRSLRAGFAWVGVFVTMHTLELMALTVLRNRGRATLFAVLSSATLILNSILVVALVVVDASPRSVLAANALSVSAIAVVALAVTRREARGRASAAEARRMLTLGLPLVPSVAALFAGELAYRAILLGAAGDAQVGLYGIAVRVSTIAVVAVLGFTTAWQPRAFELARQPHGAAAISSDAGRSIALLSILVVALALVTPELVAVFAGGAYERAVPAVGWMLVYALGFGVYQIATLPSAIATRTGEITMSSLAGVAVSVIGVALVADRHGAAGAAGAVAVGQWFAVAIATRLGRRHFAYGLPRLTMLTAPAACALALAVTVGSISLVPRLTVAALTVSAAIATGAAGRLVRYAADTVRSRSTARETAAT